MTKNFFFLVKLQKLKLDYWVKFYKHGPNSNQYLDALHEYHFQKNFWQGE